MSRHDMIKGLIPPIITPMNEDESFNEAEFRNQIERQIEGGVHGIFCYGTNGECYALNTQEKEEVLKVYEVLKKNQYGQYLKDVLDGKYREELY